MEGTTKSFGGAGNTPKRGQTASKEQPAMPTIASPRFYVYVLCRPNGKPFYVGKGQGSRAFVHETEARSGHRCHKCNVIRKIWKQGGQVQCCIVLETDDEREAFAYERELIALYGRENLCNLTDGGEGASGRKMSDKNRAQSSARMKALAQDPEYQAEHSARMRAVHQRPEQRAQKSVRMKALWSDPEWRARQLSRIRTSARDPEWRARISERQKKTSQAPQWRAENSARLKVLSKDPQWRARHEEIYQDPQYRARLSAIHKARLSDPQRRAELSERMKAVWARRKAAKEGAE